MRANRKIFGHCLMGLLTGVGTLAHVCAESSAPAGAVSSGVPVTSSTPLTAFLQERRALEQERQTLISRGGTQQQLEAWRKQNEPRFEALRQLGQELSDASGLQPARVRTEVNIPANASSALKDFLTTRASLASARAEIHNRLLQALPPDATHEQINTMQQQEEQIFQQQYSVDIQLQAQRAQALAAESASIPLPVHGVAVIPSNATPQMAAFLVARNGLAKDRAQLWNQYIAASPAVRETAMQNWRQQNAASLNQLSQLTQNLSNLTSTQEGQNQ